jgi:hypothetical protein
MKNGSTPANHFRNAKAFYEEKERKARKLGKPRPRILFLFVSKYEDAEVTANQSRFPSFQSA